MFSARAFPIQSSLFALYGSATCVGPYIGVYLLEYTIADKKDLGTLGTISALANILLRLVLGYVADRYRLHRLVYLICTLVFLVNSSSLIAPIFLSAPSSQNSPPQAEPDEPATDPDAQEASVDSTGGSQPEQLEARSREALHWFYLVASITIICELCIKICSNLADAFCANVAMKANSSYSSLRFWGAAGRTSCAIILIFVNQLKPFLLPAFLISTVLTILNVFVIAFWPNKESFDLSDKAELSLIGRSEDNNEPNLMRIKFAYATKSPWRSLGKKARKINELQVLDLESLASSVRIKKFNLATQFDTREEDEFRNIRRCSLAPLGDSYVIKQFELDSNSARHFNHVTKIEPLGKGDSKGADSPKAFEWPAPPVDLGPERAQRTGETQKDEGYEDEEDEERDEGRSQVSFAIYMRIIFMIATNNKQLVRFMLLYTANGVTAAINWMYLFPYLISVDSDKFSSLSVYILVSRYMSETLFYYISPKSLFRSISHSNSLSIILFIYGIRYSTYPMLGLPFLPLESIVLIETLRAVNMGWYNCVCAEAALEFALEANKCVPKLIASGRIENNQKTIDRLNSGFKSIMVIVSACFFDGIGFAIGGYLGSLITQSYDFNVLWLATSAFAVSASLLNILMEILLSRNKTKTTNECHCDVVS